MNISQYPLPLQLIQETSKVLVTSFGGLPLVMETFRALGLPQSIQKHLPVLQRQGRYREADYVESFVSLFATGGDCMDDFEILRADEGLKKLGLRDEGFEVIYTGLRQTPEGIVKAAMEGFPDVGYSRR
jgi:hypothetical protein